MSSFMKMMLLAALSLAAADGFAKGNEGMAARVSTTDPALTSTLTSTLTDDKGGSNLWMILLIAAIVFLVLASAAVVYFCVIKKEKKEVVVAPAGTPVTV